MKNVSVLHLKKTPTKGSRRPAPIRTHVTVLSPLRYPGAKRRLSSYVAELLRINGIKPKLFVEPLAGGASVSIELLANNRVEKIALGEKDPLVAGFWRTVFKNPEGLITNFRKLEPTVATWKKLKASKPRTDMDRAVACLFLNRTSFSGILAASAGPIGGMAQKSDYDIGCRMAPGRLEKRIRTIAELKDRVEFVNHGDWRKTLARVAACGLQSKDIFYYFDPPFYYKADRLYRHAFDDGEHVALSQVALSLKSDWLMSYDPAEFIWKLYKESQAQHVEFLYSASGGKGRGRMNELLITSLPKVPDATRLWLSHHEWKRARRVSELQEDVSTPLLAV